MKKRTNGCMDATWLKYLPRFVGDKLSGRHTLQEALSNSGWLIADRVLRIVVGLFVGIWLARYLGPDRYGQLSYAIGFASLFGAIASLGMNGIVVRDLVRLPEHKGAILMSAFVSKLVGGSFAFILALGIVRLLRPEDTVAHWLVGIVAAAMIFQSFEVVELWFQSEVQSKYAVWGKGAAFVVVSAVKIWLIMTRADLIAFAWIFLAEFVITAAALTLIFGATGNVLEMQSRWSPFAGQLLRESWPMMLSGMAIMLYMRLDIVMLREMTGEHAAGIYAAATNISEAGYFLPMVIVGSSFPAIVKYRDTDQKAYFDSFRKLYFCLAWLSVGIALPLSLLSSTIVRVLYGIQYKEAALVLAVHLWANVAIFMSVGSGHYLQAESYQVIAFYRALVGAVFNVALNVFLIPSYGAIGAAIATIISYFVTILFLVLLEKTREHAFLMLKAPFSRKY